MIITKVYRKKHHSFVAVGIVTRAAHSQQYRRQQTRDIFRIAWYDADNYTYITDETFCAHNNTRYAWKNGGMVQQYCGVIPPLLGHFLGFQSYMHLFLVETFFSHW